MIKQLFISPNTKQLLKDGFKSFGIQGSAIIISFIINLILTHLLGVKGYDIYTYAFSWSVFLGALATLGIDNLLVREIAAYKSTGKWGYIKGILRFSNIIFYSIILLLITGIGIVLYSFNIYEQDDLFYVLLTGLISFPFICKTLMNQSVMLGLNRIVLSQIGEKLYRPLLLLLLLIASTTVLGYKINALNAAIMNTSVFILVMLISGFYLSDALKLLKISNTSAPTFDNINWTKSAIAFFFISVIGLINSRADILMIGILSDNLRDVGVYNIAVRVSELLFLPILVINVVLAPLISEYYATKNLIKLKRLAINTTRISFALIFPPIIIYVSCGDYILSIFGSEYKEGYATLLILCAGKLVNILCGCVATVLLMTGYERVPAKSLIIGAVLNVILNAFLIPQYGIEGAAIGTAIGLIVNSLLMLAYTYKKLGINISIFARHDKQ